MTTNTASRHVGSQRHEPLVSVAEDFLEGVATQDFTRIAGTLGEDARLTALVPSGVKEWHGPQEISAIFRRWFGDEGRFELIDAAVGEVAARLQLRWRVRLQAERLGAGWFVIEQHVYADTGPDERIARLSLLCSGFRPEAPASQVTGTPRGVNR